MLHLVELLEAAEIGLKCSRTTEKQIEVRIIDALPIGRQLEIHGNTDEERLP